MIEHKLNTKTQNTLAIDDSSQIKNKSLFNNKLCGYDIYNQMQVSFNFINPTI